MSSFIDDRRLARRGGAGNRFIPCRALTTVLCAALILFRQKSVLKQAQPFTELETPAQLLSEHQHDRYADCPSVIIGIFSTASEGIREDDFRKWLPLHRQCGVRFVFVHGRSSELGAEVETSDTVYVNVRENMNNGKSIAWFAWASENTSAEYVFKMDLDTGVSPELLESMWSELHRLHSEYIGFPWSQDGNKLSGEACLSVPCPQTEWFYMSGGFYGLSRELARQVANQGIVSGHEDAVVGSIVHRVRPRVRTYNITCMHECRFDSKNLCVPHQCPVSHFVSDKMRASKSSIC